MVGEQCLNIVCSCADGAGTQISAHHQAKPDYTAISTRLIFDTKRHMYPSVISDSDFQPFCTHTLSSASLDKISIDI